MAKDDTQLTTSAVPRAASHPTVTLLESGLRDESGNSGDILSPQLERAKSIVFILDVSAVSGITPLLDVAIYAKLDDWCYRMLQFSQKSAVGCSARQLRRDGATFTDALTLLDTVPEPTASSGYVKDGVPWGDTFVVAYKIQGTFAPGDPGPPEVPAEGITFSVTAFPIDF